MLEEYHSYRQKQKIFSTYTRINTIPEFEEWYTSSMNRSSNVYFRGVKEAKFKNFTSAQRHCLNHNIHELPSTLVKKELQKLHKNNDNLFEKYCATIGIECTDIFLMSISQHYGGISLFLDFSKDINTALYFMSADCIENISNNDTAINNYASIYYSPQIGVPFDNITTNMSAKIDFSEKNDNCEVFQKSSLFTFRQLLSLTMFNMLYGAKPIMIENKLYPFDLKHRNYSFSQNVIVSNYHIVAQDGCLLFYDNGFNPLEENLSCADIHKSLFPYIREKYLIPNNKTIENLFPSLGNIVNHSLTALLKELT